MANDTPRIPGVADKNLLRPVTPEDIAEMFGGSSTPKPGGNYVVSGYENIDGKNTQTTKWYNSKESYESNKPFHTVISGQPVMPTISIGEDARIKINAPKSFYENDYYKEVIRPKIESYVGKNITDKSVIDSMNAELQPAFNAGVSDWYQREQYAQQGITDKEQQDIITQMMAVGDVANDTDKLSNISVPFKIETFKNNKGRQGVKFYDFENSSLTDFLNTFKDQDDEVKNLILDKLYNVASDDSVSSYDKQRNELMIQALKSASESNDDYKGILNADIQTKINRMAQGFFSGAVSIGNITGIINRIAPNAYKMDTNYLSGGDNLSSMAYLIGGLGGLATDLITLQGLQGAMANRIFSTINSNTAKLDAIGKLAKGATGTLATDLAGQAARLEKANKALRITNNLLGYGKASTGVEKIAKGVGEWADPVGNIIYGTTSAVVHPSGEYGDDYGIDDFSRDTMNNIIAVGALKATGKGLSKIGQTKLGKAASRGVKNINAKITESKVGKFFGDKFGDGFGDIRNAARRADIADGNSIFSNKVSNDITDINNNGARTMANELSASKHSVLTLGEDGTWGKFSKKYRESNPLGRNVEIFNPETNKIERIKTTDAISANAEEALGDASKWIRLKQEADGSISDKYINKANDLANKVRAEMTSKYGSELTNDSINMVEDMFRSKRNGGSINSDLEDIMSKYGLNDITTQQYLEEIDPRFAKYYGVTQQYRPTATIPDASNIAGNQSLLHGSRTRDLDKIYRAKFQNPMRAYQTKVVAVGKAIAWNNLKKTMSEMDAAMKNITAVFNKADFDDAVAKYKTMRQQAKKFNGIVTNSVTDQKELLGIDDIETSLEDLSDLAKIDGVYTYNSSASRIDGDSLIRTSNPDAFVSDDSLFPIDEVTTMLDSTNAISTPASVISAETAGEIIDAEKIIATPQVTDNNYTRYQKSQAKKAFNAQRQRVIELKKQATIASNNAISTTNFKPYNALDTAKSASATVVKDIVDGIPQSTLDTLSKKQLAQINNIKFGRQVDYSVIADSQALRNYFDAQGVHAIRQNDGTMLYFTDENRLFSRAITDAEIDSYIDMDIGGDGINQAVSLQMERTVDQLMQDDEIYREALNVCVGTNMSPRTYLMNQVSKNKKFKKAIQDRVVDRLYTGQYHYSQTIDTLIYEMKPSLFPDGWEPGSKKLTADDFKSEAEYKEYELMRSRNDIQDYAQALTPSTKKEINNAVADAINDYVEVNYIKDTSAPDQMWDFKEQTRTIQEMQTTQEAIKTIDSDPLRRTAKLNGETVSYYKIQTPYGAEYRLTTDITPANMLRNSVRKARKYDNFNAFMNASSRIYRIGTTSANFKSLVRNITRDPVEAWIKSGWNPLDNTMQYPGGIVGYLQNSEDFMIALREVYGDDAPRHLMAVAEDVADQIKAVAGVTQTSVISGRYNTVEQLTHKSNFNKVVDFLETPGDIWESSMRASVGAQTFLRNIENGKSIEDALALAKYYTSEATTNFTNAVGSFQNLARNVPYLSSAINGTRSFFRLLEQDPLGIGLRIATTIIGPQVYLLLDILTDEEKRAKYEAIPDWVKEQNIIYISDNNDCIIMPLPQEVALFMDVTRRFVQTSFDIDPEPWYKSVARGFLGHSPIDIKWLADIDYDKNVGQQIFEGVTKSSSQLVPQFGQAIYGTVTGKDLFTGQEIYGKEGSPTLNTIANLLGMNTENSVDKKRNVAIIQEWISSILGTNGSYLVNMIDSIVGADENNRGGKNFLDDMAKTFTGTGYNETRSAFYRLINDYEKRKSDLMSKDLVDINKSINQAERTADQDTIDGLKAQRQKKIAEFMDDLRKDLDKYAKTFPKTGGIDTEKKNQLIRLLNFGLDYSGIATGNMNEDTWQGEAYNEAGKGEYQDALKRYEDLGLVDPTVDSVYKDSQGNWQVIQSVATKNAIQSMYGTPKEMVYDIDKAIDGNGDVSLWDIKNEYKAQIDAIYDKAEIDGTSPDYDAIANIQREFLDEFDRYMAPVIEKYGRFVMANNKVASNLESILSGMIPTEEYQRDKSGRFRSMPMMRVNTWKWLQNHYGIGYGNTKSLPSDEEVTKYINRINQALRNGQRSTAMSLARRLNSRIGSGSLYANKSDMNKLSNVLGY